MTSHRPQALGDVLRSLIDAMGIERQLEAARIVDAWNELAGAPIAAVTERVWVREQVLYVRITSSTWRQELFLHRQAWRDRLNERLGKPLVAEIVFR